MGEEDLDVGFLLKRISTAIVRNADQGFKPITLSQMRVMMYIAHQQGHACCQKVLRRALAWRIPPWWGC